MMGDSRAVSTAPMYLTWALLERILLLLLLSHPLHSSCAIICCRNSSCKEQITCEGLRSFEMRGNGMKEKWVSAFWTRLWTRIRGKKGERHNREGGREGGSTQYEGRFVQNTKGRIGWHPWQCRWVSCRCPHSV